MSFFDLLHHTSVAFAIFLAALGTGDRLLRLMGLNVSGISRLWLATLSGLALLSISTLLIGLAGFLVSQLFFLLLMPLALIGLLSLARSNGWQEIRDKLVWPNRKPSLGITVYLLLSISAGTVLWIVVTHALMLPNEWDEIIYHLTLPKRYIEAQGLIYIPDICFSLWPMNIEMLFVISLLLGSEIAPHFIILGMAILTALGLFVTGQHYFDQRVGFIAAILFLNLPLVYRLAGTGLIDTALGLYVLAALFALNRWQEERYWPWLLLSGALAGVVAASKLSGAAIPLLLALLLLIDEWRQRTVQISRPLRHLLWFGVAGAMVAAPWYARSFLITGNPIWPFAYPLFGGQNWDALGNEYLVQAQMDLLSPYWPRTPFWLLISFVYIMTDPKEMGSFPEGLGLLPLGTLAATLLMRHAPRLLWQSLFVCAGFYLLWFGLLPLQLRYLLPIVPLLALTTAYLLIWLYDQVPSRSMQLALSALLLLLLLQQSPWSDSYQRAFTTRRLPVLRGQMSAKDWLNWRHKNFFSLYDYANTSLPDQSRILLLPFETRTYYLDQPYVWGSLTCQRILPFEQFDHATELAATLHKMGITHVLDNPEFVYNKLRHWEHDRALMLELKEQCGQVLFEQNEAVLYKLTDCTKTSH